MMKMIKNKKKLKQSKTNFVYFLKKKKFS